MILRKSLGWIANGAQSTSRQIFLSVYPIVHGVGQGIEKESVHREVTTAGIGLRVTEGHRIRPPAIGVMTVRSEGGHLKGVPVFHHQNHPEALAHGVGLGKERLHLFRPGAGGHIKILRRDPTKLIAHTAPDEVGLVVGLLQAAQYAEGNFAGSHDKKNARPQARRQSGEGGLIISVARGQHGLELGRLHLTPLARARFLESASISHILNGAFAVHLLFQAAQRTFNRFTFFQFNFRH